MKPSSIRQNREDLGNYCSEISIIHYCKFRLFMLHTVCDPSCLILHGSSAVSPSCTVTLPGLPTGSKYGPVYNPEYFFRLLPRSSPIALFACLWRK